MDRPTKVSRTARADARRADGIRMAELRHTLPYCSQSALAALISMANNDQLPEQLNRRDIQHGRDETCKEATPYGPLHSTAALPRIAENASDKHIEVQNPFAMFWKLCMISQCFSALVERTLERHPCTPSSPWGLIIYSDEVTPGNQLQAHNCRKTQAVYWSIFEFGAAALSDEESWMEVCICRSTEVKTLQGGMSALFAMVLLQFYGAAHDMHRAGIALQLYSGKRVRLFVKFLYKLADEAALHIAWGCKGSGGLKPCLRCQNVFNSKNARHVIETCLGGWAVDDTCFEPEKFVPSTRASTLQIIDRLTVAKDTMACPDLHKLETNLGWSYVLGGIMFNMLLRPIIDPSMQTAFDSMHVFMVNGIFNIHIGVLMTVLQPFKYSYSTLLTYAKAWKWPTRVGNATGIDALGPERAKGSWTAAVFKCSASEGKSLVPIIGNWCHQVLLRSTNATLRQHGACTLLLVDAMELLELSDRGAVPPSRFRLSMVTYLRTFKALYGNGPLVEKHHMALHLREHDSWCPSCWCLERKHKHVKRFTTETKNTSSDWDSSMLREITCRHLSVLKDTDSVHFSHTAQLHSPHQPNRGLLQKLQAMIGHVDIKCSATARINEYESCSKGDVVMLNLPTGIIVGRIQLHVSVHNSAFDGTFSCITCWSLVSTHERFSMWQANTETHHLVWTHDILYACIWSIDTDGIATVLHPRQYRL